MLEAQTKTLFKKGDWILIPPYEGEAIAPNVLIETANSDVYQLYNLKEDIGEQHNLAVEMPEKLQK